MRCKKSNSSVLETVLKSDVEKINAFGSLEKQNSINSLQSLIICWKEISTLQVPREGKMGGGGRIAVSRVPLLSSYFCGWLSSFPVLASVEKKNCDYYYYYNYYYKKECLKERLFY